MKGIEVSRLNGGTTVLDEATVRGLEQALKGRVLRDGDAGYDAARTVWNGMIDHRPGLLVRCQEVADVLRAVDFARDRDILVSVRAGGHNIAGKSMCAGGLVIDLSPMKGMRVDPVARTAQAQAGLRLGEFDRETQAFGLATTMGVATDTGIAGITLGGGYGWLAGKFGLACDNLISADVVTADGRLVTASSQENDDLFWGLRGGAGNFGVVTSFQYRLHPLETVLGGMVIHPMTNAARVLRFYEEYAAAAPDELTTVGALLSAPDGNPIVAIAVCYCGSQGDGENVLKPLRAFGPPAADLIRPMAYVELQAMLDEVFAPGRRYYWKSSLLRKLAEPAIETLVSHAAEKTSPMSLTVLQQLHGAAARVGAADTAFAHRYDHYNCIPLAVWEAPEDSDKNIRWARDYWEAMQPVVERDCYANDLGEVELEGSMDGKKESRVRAAWGDETYARLVKLKRKYDPANFFRLNTNIDPSG